MYSYSGVVRVRGFTPTNRSVTDYRKPEISLPDDSCRGQTVSALSPRHATDADL